MKVHPFEKVVFSGHGGKASATLRIELPDVAYSNLFSPIANGFTRPMIKLVGGRYPRFKAEEGGVTYGFGFHCHADKFGSFTPLVKREVSGTFMSFELFFPERVEHFNIETRAGGNDDDSFEAGNGNWTKFEAGPVEKGMQNFKIELTEFDNDIAFRFDVAADTVFYVKSAKAVPYFQTVAEANGSWKINFSSPFPYGFREKRYRCELHTEDGIEKLEDITVFRDDIKVPDNPADASVQWLLNRFAKPEFEARRGSFPLFYYDSASKTFYGSGHSIWIRPYAVMSLVEAAMRRKVDTKLLGSVAKYVAANHELDTFRPEKRSGYLEYCGTGNYFYGACAMLLYVIENQEIRKMLLDFVGKYMDSQKVFTPMTSYPDSINCHMRGASSPTMTVCGHEETMHAAVVEAYRQSKAPELLHEAIFERGAAFMESPVHSRIIVPERLKNLPDARNLYGYYGSMHMPWVRSRDAIHYRAEGLMRLFEVSGDGKWIELASRRISNFLRYVGEWVGKEFMDINFEYPAPLASQYQRDDSPALSTGGTDGEYYQDIYTAMGVHARYPSDMYLREKLRKSVMLAASTVKMDSPDPELHGEAWFPHYAWDNDYEKRSAGSRVLSVWTAPGLFMRAESAGFRFDGHASYHGPLTGCRKIMDASSLPANIGDCRFESYFDIADAEISIASIEIKNLAENNLIVESISINGKNISGETVISNFKTTDIAIKDKLNINEQNRFEIKIGKDSSSKFIISLRFAAENCKLGAYGMDEYFGGRFVRRNIVFNNPFSSVAEKSWHDPSDPETYFRKLPEDEGLETTNEISYIKTWEPFIELGSRTEVSRAVSSNGKTSIRFKRIDNEDKVHIFNELWTDENGRVINGTDIPSDGASFSNPRHIKVVKAWKDGELDPLHRECSLPALVYMCDGLLCADIMNYAGSSSFNVELLTSDEIVLGIPARSDDCTVFFNNEKVYHDGSLKMPNASRIKSTLANDGFIRFRMQRKGSLKVRLASETAIPGRPTAITAAHIDGSGLTSSHVRIRWQPNLEAATGYYNVYRATCLDATPEFIGWSPETTLTDFSAESGIEYHYYVQAVAKDGTCGNLSQSAILDINKLRTIDNLSHTEIPCIPPLNINN